MKNPLPSSASTPETAPSASSARHAQQVGPVRCRSASGRSCGRHTCSWRVLTGSPSSVRLVAVPASSGWSGDRDRYHHLGGRAGQGNASLIDQIHEPTQWVPRRTAPPVLAGTWVTHLFGGSAGRESTALADVGQSQRRRRQSAAPTVAATGLADAAAASKPVEHGIATVRLQRSTVELVGICVGDRFDVFIERGAVSASFGDQASLSVEFGSSEGEVLCGE